MQIDLITYPLGSAERPLRVAIVGAGPAGFFAAEALVRRPGLHVEIDLLDRLPTPFGLVRGGVAPDHQKIKSVARAFEQLVDRPQVRFFGNVRFSEDVTLEDLRHHYDRIVLAVGNETDRRLSIPGEDLVGSHSATAFVGWYNGHPDYCDRSFDLTGSRAAIVGVGNVAIDVARILARDPETLAATDIAGYALEALRQSGIREIFLLGRRGPAQAAFAPGEIRELGALESADLVVRPEELEPEPLDGPALESTVARRNLEYLAEVAARGERGRRTRVRLRFRVSPVAILGDHGRVTGIRLEKNRLEADAAGRVRAVGTGELEDLPVDLVFRSIGYYGIPLAGVPFDRRTGCIPNEAGQVIDPASGQPVPDLFVVGWAARGPVGLIGDNRRHAAATMERLMEGLTGRRAPVESERSAAGALEMLRRRQPQLVTEEGWRTLNRLELSRGASLGKVREKFTRVDEMLEVAQTSDEP